MGVAPGVFLGSGFDVTFGATFSVRCGASAVFDVSCVPTTGWTADTVGSIGRLVTSGAEDTALPASGDSFGMLALAASLFDVMRRLATQMPKPITKVAAIATNTSDLERLAIEPSSLPDGVMAKGVAT